MTGLKHPWWYPESLSRRLPNLVARGRVLAATRAFMAGQELVEVETPALQISPGMEPHLLSFVTELRGVHPDQRRLLHLHTSPEFAMKKLLVAGMPRIWQLAKVFRNGERSDTHHPEFSMLEWYRAGAELADLMDDCVALVRAAAHAAGRDRFRFRGLVCDPYVDWHTVTVAEAFQAYAGIDLLATAPDPYVPDRSLLAEAASRAGIRVAEDDRWDDIFFRVMFERIEPVLGAGAPTFLTDYPLSMAALSRPKAGDPRLSERFELYICGLELANAFGELTDAAAQRARFEADLALQERLYGRRTPIDEEFLAALAYGMPDSAGIALGFDRLVMLCAGVETIEAVLWAPVTAP